MSEENFSETALHNISVSDSTKTVDLSRVSDVIINLLEQELNENALDLFASFHPVDKAEILIEMPRLLQYSLLNTLEVESIREILSTLDPSEAASIYSLLPETINTTVLNELSADVATDILRALPEVDAQAALDKMDHAEDVLSLIVYPDDSAGGLMLPPYNVVKATRTAGVALDALRLASEATTDINIMFVIDDNFHPVGYLSIKKIALARASTPIPTLMKPIPITVSVSADQEECVRIIERYDLQCLGVTNPSGQLVGVIDSEDLLDVAEAEASEDMFKIAGMSTEKPQASISKSLRGRAPWLVINLATTFAAAGIIQLFESTIAKAAVLAVFLPVVAGQGGIGGTQTLTLTVRSIALGELPGNRGRKLLLHEATLGILNGIYLGLVVAIICSLWIGNPLIGLVLGVAMFGNMVIAGVVGASIPLILRKIRQDPAISSAVVVTTFTDIVGFLLFLGLASLIINNAST